jgi:NodT family efflux transporter outer membrane factor (OMF) lipoprotein
LALLTACSVGPRFERPTPALPTQWNAASAEPSFAQQTAQTQWWTIFNDPLLNELVEHAQKESFDVRVAALRLAQSRVQRDAIAGNTKPSVSASASYRRERQSEFGTSTRLIDAIGSPANRDAIIDLLSEPYNVYQGGFDASWELDLWGRIAHAIESGDAALSASREDVHDAQLTVIAEVARNYFELRGVQDQLRISSGDITAGEDALELMGFRADGGAIPQLDVISQRARLADARARVPQLRQSETQILNALALLLAQPPDALRERLAAAQPMPALPATVAISVPSEVARQRPDILRAEARLHAATADTGVAVADLYPRFTLTGSFLSQSLAASDFTEWGARQWSIGPTLSLPLFDGGRRHATVELRQLQQQEAAVNYQRTVLRAWHEVENSLSAYASERSRNAELANAVEASRDAYQIANLRYERGLTNFIVALDAQRTLLQSERAFSDSRTALATQLVTLHKALGGGWPGEGL